VPEKALVDCVAARSDIIDADSDAGEANRGAPWNLERGILDIVVDFQLGRRAELCVNSSWTVVDSHIIYVVNHLFSGGPVRHSFCILNQYPLADPQPRFRFIDGYGHRPIPARKPRYL